MRTEASADLIARARHDRDAFGELYALYVHRIYAFCLMHTGHAQQAEDLTSSTFERALAKIDRYEDRGIPFSSWLLRIAANATAESARRAGLGDGRAIIFLDDMHPRQDARVVAWEDDPVQWVERWERAGCLDRYMATLPTDQRMALRLRYFEDRSLDDMAQTLNRNSKATRQRLHRAVSGLRNRMMLDEDGIDDDGPRAPRDIRRRGRRSDGV